MGTLLQDIRYGLRLLRKNLGFTAVAVLTLALGIGANTAIFSVVDAVLVRPLPYPDPQRMFMVCQTRPEMGATKNGVSFLNYLDWSRATTSFEALAAIRGTTFALTGRGPATYVEAAAVTADYFPVFRVQPVLGRTLEAADDVPGASPAVVMSERLWQSRFGSDPAIVGQTISLDQHPFTVAGILPGNFRPPLTASDTQLWVPLLKDTVASELRNHRSGHYLTTVGRLKPGVTPAHAQAEMDSIESGLERQYPDDDKGWGVRLISLQGYLVGDVQTALLVILGAVGLVFLIACTNVANLQLARATSRGREVSIRLALGASRARLIRQFLTECILLSLAGGLAGLAVAYGTVQGLTSWLPAELPRISEIRTDARVLLFGLALSVLAGIVFGLAPAWHSAESRLVGGLKESGKGMGGDKSRRRLRGVLVVAETGLAVVLLVGAGLLIRSFIRLQEVNTGFNAKRLLTTSISLPPSQYTKPEQWISFSNEIIERMKIIPGVEDAGVTLSLPLAGGIINLGFTVEGRAPVPKSEGPTANYAAVSPNYFHLMQIPLLRGREFGAHDSPQAAKVCVISAAVARRVFPNEDPLGKRINIGYPHPAAREIVGIVGDVKDQDLAAQNASQIYAPFVQNPYGGFDLAVRTWDDEKQISRALREKFGEIDPGLPVTNIRAMSDAIDKSIAQPRFRTTLLGLFSAVAFLLAAIGIYGVISYNVGSRTQEIGIRIALGAQGADVLLLVLREAVALAGLGVVLGLVGAFWVMGLLESFVFNVSLTDPVTYAGVAGLLLVVSFVAACVPARRAMRVDPMAALRYE
jgi:putative ABC transport system permease protein